MSKLKWSLALCLALMMGSAAAADTLKVLIVDGQNNHGNWPTTTKMMRQYLEQTKLFTVDVATTPPAGQSVADYRPKFADYDVVVSNYNGALWSKETQDDFVSYMRAGGGFVVVHAADNAFGDWKEYNEIIGLGGWGGRNEKSGPYVYYNAEGPVRDLSVGSGGSHGAQHPFQVVIRNSDHPITRGLPLAWMHEKDELYNRLRGPATNMRVLATAYAEPKKGGTGRHEPMLLTIEYGKGRVFHTPMGHGNYSQECVGFITCLQRGAEWVATGNVTQAVPDDFPTSVEISLRKFEEKK